MCLSSAVTMQGAGYCDTTAIASSRTLGGQSKIPSTVPDSLSLIKWLLVTIKGNQPWSINVSLPLIEETLGYRETQLFLRADCGMLNTFSSISQMTQIVQRPVKQQNRLKINKTSIYAGHLLLTLSETSTTPFRTLDRSTVRRSTAS